jgi:NAD(P)-dependent dehydrogenase (short-subunit alcohol dehydrogenase family)
VINNAGVFGPRSLLAAPLEEVRAVYEANVFGPLAVARAAGSAVTSEQPGRRITEMTS